MADAATASCTRRRFFLDMQGTLTLAIMAAGILLTLVTLALLALYVGISPWLVITTLATGAAGSTVAISSTLQEMVPIALTALAFYIPYKAGFFNIGAQGQLEVGALAALLVVTTVATPAPLTIVLAFAAAATAGALILLPALLLKSWRGASEVTTTIMLNLIAVEFVLAMVSGPMKDPMAFYTTTEKVPEPFRLPGGGFHVGVWIALAIILVVHWVLKRSVFGFRLEAVGGNPVAASVAGMRVGKVLWQAILASGAIAGIAGAMQALGVVHQVAEGWSRPWGFVGILAALLGRTPVGIIFASLLLAGLETGGRHMQAMTGVPAAMVYVLQGLPVLFFLGMRATPFVREMIAQRGRN